MPSHKPRIAILGLDGLSLLYLKKLFSRASLPNIKKLYKNGCPAFLYAFPPVTYPSWTSIFTGTKPKKHGIVSFNYYSSKRRTFQFYTSLDLKVPRVFEILGMRGIPSLVINPIPSYPVIRLKNVNIISHMFFTPKISYYPFRLKEYAKILSNASAVPEYQYRYSDKVIGIYSNLIDKLISSFKKISLFWLNLMVPDAFLHFYPDLLYISYKKEIYIFEKIDELIGKILENFDMLIILSDHGFTKYSKILNINDILYENGLLYVDKFSEKEKIFRTTKVFYWKFLPFVFRSRLRDLSINFNLINKNLISDKTEKINFAKSKAFMPSHASFSLYVNDSSSKKQLVNLFEEYNKMVKLIPFKDDSSPEHYPDFLLYPNFYKGYILGFSSLFGKDIISVNIADHHPFGFFLLYSNIESYEYETICNEIRKTKKVENYSIAPLILYLLKMEIPSYMDINERFYSIFSRNIKRFNDIIPKWNIVKKFSNF